MIDEQLPHYDLEAFQRWALVVDDQLQDAVDAMVALEEPDSEPFHDHSDLLQEERSGADLGTNLIQEINAFKEYPDRPAWFTPALQMVLVTSTWATFLMDYLDEVMSHGPSHVGAPQRRLIIETIGPALEHFGRFVDAVRAAGHLAK
jgi:hypothetical protein